MNILPERLERISKGIPLWILPWSMELNEDEKELARNVLDKLTRALSISSRGNQQEKTALVRELGQVFREKKHLVEILKTHLNEGKFAVAFAAYANEKRPKLMELASRIGDTSNACLESIKALLRESGSWQGKEEDVDKAFSETYKGLMCCELVSEIANAPLHNFEDARKCLNTAIKLDNRLPLVIWQKSFPGFARLFDILEIPALPEERLDELYGLLKNNSQTLKESFFDPGHKVQLKWIGEKFAGLWPGTLEESMAAYAALPETSSELAEHEFEKSVADMLEKMARNRYTSRLAKLWSEKSGSENIEQWSLTHKVPPQFAIQVEDSRFAADLANVLLAPESAAAQRLEEAVQHLEKTNSVRDPASARDAFLQHISSARHKNILIWAGPQLTSWLAEKISPTPMDWLLTPAFQNYIDEFVANYYTQTGKPRATSVIDEMTESKAKLILKELAQTIPDVGFYILKNHAESD